MTETKIAPSLLAADFASLSSEVAKVERSVDWLHLDVMDGHFVPNITFGIPVIAALRRHSELRFDCHLMTTNPDVYLEELKDAGADLVTMHIEAIPDPTPAIRRGRDVGLDIGLVVNPGTPIEAIEPYLELIDVAVVMSVAPGFGGQDFDSGALEKLTRLREIVENRGLTTDIEVDGGITAENVGLAARAGANVFVAGTAIFGAVDPATAVEELRRAIENNE
jgi:ribulose-phosphate 3-epimerase